MKFAVRRRPYGVWILVTAAAFNVVAMVGRADAQTTAPTSYSAYTGTDPRPQPAPPALGPANSSIVDPTFGSRILRVTDGNTLGGKSLIPSDSGFTRTFNANSTAIKLSDEMGWSYWLEFNPATFKVGNGTAQPSVHALTAFDARWEWSSVDPDVMYVLRGSAIGKFNKATGSLTDLASTPTGESLAYHAAVVGADAWVCSAAGAGIQDSFTKIFCVNPNSTPTTKFIDVVNRTINGVYQSDPNWPTSGSSGTIGIHSMYGSAGGTWLGITFHNHSWGANGDAVLNLSTNTWSRLGNGDIYWAGHVSLGNGKFVNGSGSINGSDARGAVVRDPNDLMNASKYQFIMQPAATCCWNDGEHSSWFNSANTPNAPVLFSRYTANTSPWVAWQSEIVMAATDGSNTVWRFAHTHDSAGGCYYGEAFAQVSPDGHWALFSSPWGNSLGGPSGFGCPARVDTFIVELGGTGGASAPASGVQVALNGPSGLVAQPFAIGGWAVDHSASSGTGVDAVHVWAWPTNGAAPIFVGIADYGWSRPDVASALGAQYATSGFGAGVSRLPVGEYQLVALAHSTVTGQFTSSAPLKVSIDSRTHISIDTPGPGNVVSTSFAVAGWAADFADATAAGIGAVHVYVQPYGGGTQTWLGAATIYGSRPDVGAALGARFSMSGFNLTVPYLAPGTYNLIVYAVSFNSQAVNSVVVPIVVN